MDSIAPLRDECPQGQASALVRAYIDSTLTALLHELLRSPTEARPSITLKRKAKAISCVINPDNGALEAGDKIDAYKTYSWPGRTAYEAWKFSAVIRILAIIEQALRSGHSITKRDIYYMDRESFGSQTIVDRVVDDLAYTIGVDRAALNVEAAAKGLMIGRLRWRNASHTLVDVRSASEVDQPFHQWRASGSFSQDILIPRMDDIADIDICDVRWVLLVEKEAVFHRLARSSYHTKAIAGEGILVTGKGYPDLCTRAFVRRLFDAAAQANRPRVRFYALADGDPDGMAILSTYKYGSAAQAHDNARLSIPGLQWLGLRLSDAVTGPEPTESGDLLSLTARDRKKVAAMLRNSPVWATNGPEPDWRAELQRMLMLNAKAEIEVLYERAGGLEGWIDRKMFRQA